MLETPARHLEGPQTQRHFYEQIDLVHSREPERTDVQLDVLRRSGLRSHRVLDLGCGEGRQVERMRALLGDPVVVGLDLSTSVLLQARAEGAVPVTAAIDEETLPFRDGAFDLVVFSEVIEHLVDTDGVLDEILRVLAPGGTLIISTPNLGAWFNRALLALGRQPVFSEVSRRKVYGRGGSQLAGHLRLYTHRAFREFLADRDLAELEIRGAPFHDVPRPMGWLDRLLARRAPSLAAILVARAVKPIGR
jgi:methionine biosynthesis protein MetW